MTTLTIPKKVENEMKRVSSNLGLTTGDFALNAILYYMKRIKDGIDLKSEMDAWDKLSDEAFIGMNL